MLEQIICTIIGGEYVYIPGALSVMGEHTPLCHPASALLNTNLLIFF